MEPRIFTPTPIDVNDRGHRLRSGSPVTNFPRAAAATNIVTSDALSYKKGHSLFQGALKIVLPAIDDYAKGGLTQFWEPFTMISCTPKYLKR